MISRIAKFLRLAQEVSLRAKTGRLTGISRVLPRIFHPAFRMDVAFRRVRVPMGRNPFLRLVRMVVRGGRGFRPLSSLAIHHRQADFERLKLRKFFPLASKKLADDSAIQNIRNLFSTNVRYNKGLVQDSVPSTIDAYEIGENIGYGSNAAVYALRVRESGDLNPSVQDTSEVTGHYETESLKAYPLALKLMFNYELDRGLNDDHLWRSMGAELVPLPGSSHLLRGRMGSYHPLPSRHPNIVRLLTAFVDRMPLLPDARRMYPEALPTAGFYDITIREPRTMFVIMKRYRMTLRDYVENERRNYWTGRVLLGQLLEGCVFLHDNSIAQRDMKSDNILLEFNDQDEVPHLVISDFGCALVTGSFKVDYRDDTIDLGGNLATRAPEVRNAQPGENQEVDFSMADTWAAGGLAYEIFTRRNPFYSQLKSGSYVEEDLPPLPSRIPYAVRNAVADLLKQDPKERLLPHVAANIVCLSLFRFGGNVREFLAECGISELSPAQLRNSLSKSLRELGAVAERALDGVLSLLAAESMIARGLAPPVVSEAELQLRATFLSRMDRNHVWDAVGYFFAPNDEDRLSLNSFSKPELKLNGVNGIHFSPRICSR